MTSRARCRRRVRGAPWSPMGSRTRSPPSSGTPRARRRRRAGGLRDGLDRALPRPRARRRAPRRTAEVAAVLRACGAHGAAVVPQGGNTGLVGGGVPRGGEVVLSSARLTRSARSTARPRRSTAGAGRDARRAAGARARRRAGRRRRLRRPRQRHRRRPGGHERGRHARAAPRHGARAGRRAGGGARRRRVVDRPPGC